MAGEGCELLGPGGETGSGLQGQGGIDRGRGREGVGSETNKHGQIIHRSIF